MAPPTALPAVRVMLVEVRVVWSSCSEKVMCGNMLMACPIEPLCGKLVAELRVGATVSMAIARLVTGVMVGFDAEVTISPSAAMPTVKALALVTPLESDLNTMK